MSMVNVHLRRSLAEERMTISVRSLALLCLAAVAFVFACGIAAPPQAFAHFGQVATNYNKVQDVPQSGDSITAADFAGAGVADGSVYAISATTSSPTMCKLTNVSTTFYGGELYATFTMTSAYNALYVGGDADEAADACGDAVMDPSPYYVDPNSPLEGDVTRTFTIPIGALNEPMLLATFSGGRNGIEKGLWYTRTVRFDASDEVMRALEGAAEPTVDGVQVVLNVGGPYVVGQLGVSASVVASYSDGSSVDATGEASWNSSNPGVVSVDASGTLAFVGEGSAELSAAVGDVWSDPVSVTVRSDASSGDPDDNPTEKGGSDPGSSDSYDIEFSVGSVDGSNGNVYRVGQKGVVASVPGQDVGWESTDEGVFSVSGAGKLTFVAEGAAELHAIADGQVVAAETVTVVSADGDGKSKGSATTAAGKTAGPTGLGGTGESGNSGSNGTSAAGASSKQAGASKGSAAKKSSANAKLAHGISIAGATVVPLGDLPTEKLTPTRQEKELDLTPFMVGGVGVVVVNLGLAGALLMGMRRTRPKRFPNV